MKGIQPLDVPAAPVPRRTAQARWHRLIALLLSVPGGAMAQGAADGPGKLLSPDGVPLAPEAGGPRNFRATGAALLMEAPATTGRVLGTYPPGASFDNLGCRRVHAQLWCDVQPPAVGLADICRSTCCNLPSPLPPEASVMDGEDDPALRDGDADVTVVETRPADRGRHRRNVDLNIIRLGHGRQEITEAVVLGE